MICLWPLPEGLPRLFVERPVGMACPRLSPDGQLVLPRGASNRGGTQLETRVYQADSGKAAGPPLDVGGILLDAAFSPDGSQVATASSTARTPAGRQTAFSSPTARAATSKYGIGKTVRLARAGQLLPNRAAWSFTRMAAPCLWSALTIVCCSLIQRREPYPQLRIRAFIRRQGGEMPTSGGQTARPATAQMDGSW